MGKVTLKSPWPKIRNLCGTLHIPVPSLEPPGPSELGEEVEEPESEEVEPGTLHGTGALQSTPQLESEL